MSRFMCSVAALATGILTLLFFFSYNNDICHEENLTCKWGAGSYLCLTGAIFRLWYGVIMGLSVKPTARRNAAVAANDVVQATDLEPTPVYSQVPSSSAHSNTGPDTVVEPGSIESGGDFDFSMSTAL